MRKPHPSLANGIEDGTPCSPMKKRILSETAGEAIASANFSRSIVELERVVTDLRYSQTLLFAFKEIEKLEFDSFVKKYGFSPAHCLNELKRIGQ